MLKREHKLLFYAMCGPLLWASGTFYRHFRAPRDGTIKIHLGPGQRNYLQGWINVDANMFTGKCDVWANLQNPLPFADSTVSAVYSHQVIEHLEDPFYFFREIYRVLKPGGVARIGAPNGDAALKKFAEGDLNWFPDYPDKRTSIGGRMENFIFCRGEHLTVLTYSYFEELALTTGFKDVKEVEPAVETNYPELIDKSVLALEPKATVPGFPVSVIIECRKPL